MKAKKDLELYIHIPFCQKKCDYCDFISGPSTREQRQHYYESLKRELYCYQDNPRYPIEDYQVKTIFFGGGTPTIMEEDHIAGIMETIFKVFSCGQKEEMEITIEANPGTLSLKKLKTYQKAGINRLSIGLQSADNKELKALGRIHTWETFVENYYLARQCGFHNINIDLMSALPGQTLDSWKNTLQAVINLEPEHISAYSLILEEGTPFFKRYEHTPELLPDEDTERAIYYETKQLLTLNHYTHYEISNYARPGYECQHNIGYWECRDYLGIGISAASLFENRRFNNHSDLNQYLNQYLNAEEYLEKLRENDVDRTREEAMEEFMFLGLRKIKGIQKKDFEDQFHQSLQEIYGPIMDKLIQKELIYETEESLYLTQLGIDVSNYVLSEFLMA